MPILTSSREASSSWLPVSSSRGLECEFIWRTGSRAVCSSIPTGGIAGGPISGEECGLAGGEPGGGAPDSRGFSRDSGEGGSNVMSSPYTSSLLNNGADVLGGNPICYYHQ